jgi:cell division protein FtsN
MSIMPDSVIEASVNATETNPQKLAPLDAPQEVMAALYTAALGPVNLMYYLNLFSRYDSIKQSSLGWNWSAAFCTLPWMAFRQLWGPALIYVAAAEGLALLGLGLGRNVLHWSSSIEWGFIAVLILASIIVPGLYGNAMVHSETRKKIHKALAATRTVPEAYDALLKQASGWKRLTITAVCACAAVALAAVALIVWPPGSKSAHTQGAEAKAASTPLMLDATPTVAQDLSNQTSVGADQAAPPAIKAPATVSSESGLTSTNVAAVQSTPQIPPAPKANQLSPEHKAPESKTSVLKPTNQAKEDVAFPASTSAAKTSAQATAAQIEADNTRQPTTQRTNPPTASSQNSERDSPTKPSSSSAQKPNGAKPQIDAASEIGQAPGYYINVGLFAQSANARVTQSRLLNEGLPAFRQPAGTESAPRTRVRVGPFESKTQAETAALKIKSMGLDSLIFQQTQSQK